MKNNGREKNNGQEKNPDQVKINNQAKKGDQVNTMSLKEEPNHAKENHHNLECYSQKRHR